MSNKWRMEHLWSILWTSLWSSSYAFNNLPRNSEYSKLLWVVLIYLGLRYVSNWEYISGVISLKSYCSQTYILEAVYLKNLDEEANLVGIIWNSSVLNHNKIISANNIISSIYIHFLKYMWNYYNPK